MIVFRQLMEVWALSLTLKVPEFDTELQLLTPAAC